MEAGGRMTISPTRLQLARKLRGLTLAELGRETSLSGQTISRYENGRQEPTSDSIEHLANALGLPAEFFEGPEIDEVPIDAVSFRALSKTPAFRRDAARAAGELATSIAAWISSRYALPEPDLPSLNIDQDAEMELAETAAEKVRAQWGLGSRPISSVIHLLEAHGIRVFSLAQDVRDVDAFSYYKEGIPYVFIDTGKTPERQRFDAAHELGHLIMHQGPERPGGRNRERQADRFAAALLMPRQDVLSRNLRNASTTKVVAGSRRWKVSSMALAHRLWEIGIVTEWGYRSLCIELSKMGYRRSEPGSDLLPERSQILAKVFAHLRSTGLGPRQIAKDLNLTQKEFNRHVFGLATTMHNGEHSRQPNENTRRRLRVVD
jgi:Zn-dependent peptidase ImmA (M78 family)/DNA-binding XRE family transcriptional regulator